MSDVVTLTGPAVDYGRLVLSHASPVRTLAELPCSLLHDGEDARSANVSSDFVYGPPQCRIPISETTSNLESRAASAKTNAAGICLEVQCISGVDTDK